MRANVWRKNANPWLPTREVDLGDYETGDGCTVPANNQEYGNSVGLGWRPAEETRIAGSYLPKELRDVDYPSLPMDKESSTANTLPARL